MNIAVAPCKGCKDRKLGCHGKCDRYKKYRQAKDKENEKHRQDSLFYDYWKEHHR